jgi:hypothetical protein
MNKFTWPKAEDYNPIADLRTMENDMIKNPGIVKIAHTIVIPGNTPSAKNSKVMVSRKNKETGKTSTFIFGSKTTQKWLKEAKKYLQNNIYINKEWAYPIGVHFHFVRESHRRFDHINIAQACQDLLQHMEIIIDDDSDHLIPIGFSKEYDKKNPCAILTIYEYGNY